MPQLNAPSRRGDLVMKAGGSKPGPRTCLFGMGSNNRTARTLRKLKGRSSGRPFLFFSTFLLSTSYTSLPPPLARPRTARPAPDSPFIADPPRRFLSRAVQPVAMTSPAHASPKRPLLRYNALLGTVVVTLAALSFLPLAAAQAGRIQCGKNSPKQHICDALVPPTSRRSMKIPLNSECVRDPAGGYFCGYAGAS